MDKEEIKQFISYIECNRNILSDTRILDDVLLVLKDKLEK